MLVLVRADMDEQTAYNITRGITENLDKYKAAHRLLEQAVSLESFTEKALAPFHPGAAQYFAEKGLMK
jgi:TRAP-type uncharacterized transport system substrate-binding protein